MTRARFSNNYWSEKTGHVLNQVELWFAKIERDVLARGIFTSVSDLRWKIMRYIRRCNTSTTPVRWSYANPASRIA